MESKRFGAVDYVVFSLNLVISLGIGVYFSQVGGKQKDNKEYLVGDRRMNFLPVALSIMASYVAAGTILGHPAEMYLYGTMWSVSWLAVAIAAFLAALIWVPLLHPMKLTSSNQVRNASETT